MIFHTAYCEPRPVRLSEKTRQFAWNSMHFQYGLEAMNTMYVDMSEVPGYASLSRLAKYDACVRQIAEKAPIRIVPGELVSGSATLGGAIDAYVPAWFQGDYLCSCASHLTVGFDRVLKIGMDGIEAEIDRYSAANTDPVKAETYRSMKSTVESMRIWHKRYLDALPKDSANYRNLSRVPFSTPRSFYEAVQSLWFCFSYVRLLGNWTGVGRLDQMLGSYLRNDLEKGILTLDEAREILAHFFIKGCEWIRGKGIDGTVSGDSQHYQNIVLGGVNEDGSSGVNEVTYLVLDIIEEFGIGEFPVTVAIDKNTDEKLLRRMAEVIRHGGGTVAVYNNDVVLSCMEAQGISRGMATKYANDGCWEVQIPGHTCFCYTCLDTLAILQHRTLEDGNAHFESFDAVLEKYDKDLFEEVQLLHEDGDRLASFFRNGVSATHDTKNAGIASDFFCRNDPSTVIDIFEESCIRRGLGYYVGGPDYTIFSPHMGGLADTVNSLYAILKAVFEDKIVSFDELMRCTRENWENDEILRQKIRNGYRWFGNDNDEADRIYTHLIDRFSDMCKTCDVNSSFRYTPGISTFGRQVGWTENRMATVFGTKKGTILSGNSSPTPGTDRTGATAMIRSYCKADATKVPIGSALDLSLTPGSVKGEDGITAITGLLRGFTALGGFFMQMDVVSVATLRAAKEHPEDYPTLGVRVSGWNAGFVTLGERWQDMIIERDEKQE